MTENNIQSTPEIPAEVSSQATDMELALLIDEYLNKGKTPKGLPDTIKVGYCINLISISSFCKKMGIAPKAAYSILTALSIPLIFIQNKAYYNEYTLEVILHLLSRPGGTGFAPASCHYVSSGKAERDKHLRSPVRKVSPSIIKEAGTMEALEEMVSMRTLKASAITGTVRKLSPETRQQLKDLMIDTKKELDNA